MAAWLTRSYLNSKPQPEEGGTDSSCTPLTFTPTGAASRTDCGTCAHESCWNRVQDIDDGDGYDVHACERGCSVPSAPSLKQSQLTLGPLHSHLHMCSTQSAMYQCHRNPAGSQWAAQRFTKSSMILGMLMQIMLEFGAGLLVRTVLTLPPW